MLRDDPRIAEHIRKMLNEYIPIAPVDQRTLQVAIDAYLVLLAAKGNIRECIRLLKEEVGADWPRFFQV